MVITSLISPFLRDVNVIYPEQNFYYSLKEAPQCDPTKIKTGVINRMASSIYSLCHRVLMGGLRVNEIGF